MEVMKQKNIKREGILLKMTSMLVLPLWLSFLSFEKDNEDDETTSNGANDDRDEDKGY